MKTANLIPLILIELNDGDKYGFELTKSIETKSQGKIVIKQPTLYTVLKKLEKSKFITSYWKDSEIGGKRHYYKITENGLTQLETLPSYDVLISNILEEETDGQEDVTRDEIAERNEEISSIQHTTTAEQTNPNQEFSIFDVIDVAQSPIPTEEVFVTTTIDSATEVELNQQNAATLKTDTQNKDESFAANENVLEFTKKNLPEVTKPKIKQKINEKLEPEYFPPVNNYSDAKFIDYVDFRKTDKYKKDNILMRKILLKSLYTNLYLLSLIIISCIITSFTKGSPFYYVCLIFAILTILLYPTITLSVKDGLKQKIEDNQYAPKLKTRFILSFINTLIIAIAGVVICVTTDTYNITANIIAPTLFATCALFDCFNLKLILKHKEK